MSDYIVHASGAGNQVRIFAASTRDLVEKAREIHNTSPVATAALGRLLTAGAMMGSITLRCVRGSEPTALSICRRGQGH